MKKEQLLSWYSKLKELEITPNDAIALLLMLLSKEKEINFSMEDSKANLYRRGFLDDKEMLTKKALGLFKIPSDKQAEELAGEIRGRFPKIIIPTSGKAARSSINEIIGRLIWFKGNYEYSNDIILKATEEYINFFRDRNWAYMQHAAYFIKKEDKNKITSSTLAEWCDKISGEEEIESFDINI